MAAASPEVTGKSMGFLGGEKTRWVQKMKGRIGVVWNDGNGESGWIRLQDWQENQHHFGWE